jgi:hypothetical protein
MKMIFSLALCSISSVSLAQDRPSSGNYFVPADQIPWVEETIAPVELGPLWGVRSEGEAGILIRTAGKFHAGPHFHTADYWGVVVEGVWEHWVTATGEGRGIRLEPGSHWMQVKDQPHEDMCISESRCVIFLFNKEPYETQFLPGQAE